MIPAAAAVITAYSVVTSVTHRPLLFSVLLIKIQSISGDGDIFVSSHPGPASSPVIEYANNTQTEERSR